MNGASPCRHHIINTLFACNKDESSKYQEHFLGVQSQLGSATHLIIKLKCFWKLSSCKTLSKVLISGPQKFGRLKTELGQKMAGDRHIETDKELYLWATSFGLFCSRCRASRVCCRSLCVWKIVAVSTWHSATRKSESSSQDLCKREPSTVKAVKE